MEIIRRNTDYALRGLIYLMTEGSGRISGTELAQQCGIPRSFAYKILKKLARAGLLDSYTGRLGGFRLAQNPQDIPLLKVVEVIQGPVLVSKCVLNLRACSRYKKCPLSKKWKNLQRQVFDFFLKTSLADVLKA